MTAKLISYSQIPAGGFVGGDDAQDLIAYCARISNPSNQRNKDTAEKLLKYLIKHKHWRMQDPKNRQNSTNTTPHGIQDEWDMKQQEVIEKSKEVYNWAIDKGIAKEQARAVLPEGLTMSRLYVNGTLRSWVHFIELRSGHGTQKEHIDVAKACAWEIAPIFPMIQDFVTHD